MSEIDTPQATTEVAPKTDNDGFLTKEALQDRARFSFEERTLDLPEFGGKVGLRGLSVGDRESLSKRMPDSPKAWKRMHTAMSLAEYVIAPEMTTDEWTETIAPWPASALDRINREISEIINVTTEEENAAGMEFPGSDD